MLAVETVTAGKVEEVLTMLSNRITSGENLAEVHDTIEDLGDKDLKVLIQKVGKYHKLTKEKYLAAFKSEASKVKGSLDSRQITQLRREFLAMSNLADEPLKKKIVARGEPIMSQLRSALVPSTESLRKACSEKTCQQRELLVNLSQVMNSLYEADLTPDVVDQVEEIEKAEKVVSMALSQLDKKGVRIMESNKKVFEQSSVPEPEWRGVADCNVMRLLLGLNALKLDPKLCEAARDHSKDMEEHNFFAHESPVAGKKTPWDRAKRFGTTASGENIFAGRPDPIAANQAWFYSPGHHRNMFKTGHQRIGLGQHNSHWTQLFGR